MEVIKCINHRLEFTEVNPLPDKAWNNWLHATKNGNPYLVFKYSGIVFSLMAFKRQREWVIRWPFPSADQKMVKFGTADEVVTFLAQGNKTP